MKTIYKYTLYPGRNTLTLPEGSQILSVAAQGDILVLYALVTPEGHGAGTEEWVVQVHGTGWTLSDPDAASFVGTIMLLGGALVYHVFATRREDPAKWLM